ncbi:hypothetical protein ABIA00_006631 [Bradyrhizobium ottawaense]
MSRAAQTGQSEEIHSPEEWASRVVRWMWPVVGSTRVVWMVAISCWLSVLRTMSRPLASEA